MDGMTNDVLRTTLKHLHVRRDNFSRNAEVAKSPGEETRHRVEIQDLTEAIIYFETIRSERGL